MDEFKDRRLPSEEEMQRMYSGYGEPFEYKYQLSGSSRFEAVKQNDGTIRAQILKDEQTVFDFASLLPKGWKFASFDYVAKLSELTGDEITWVGWLADHKRKLVTMEDLEGPEEILSILHEIGHARTSTLKDWEEYEEAREKYYKAENKADEIFWHKKCARLSSVSERKSWAEAIRLFRRICRETNVEIKEFFANRREMMENIMESLASHREQYDWLIDTDPNFLREFKKLFEKGKFKENNR